MKNYTLFMLALILAFLGASSCKAQEQAKPLSPLAKLLTGKDIIGYVHKGNLNLMDINSKEELNLISSGNVLDFCWDKTGDKIYVAEIDSAVVLSCLEYDLQTSLQKKLYAKDLSSVEGYEHFKKGYARPQNANSDLYLSAKNEVVTYFEGSREPVVKRIFLIYNLGTNALNQYAVSPVYLGEKYALPYWDASWFHPSLISQEETKDIINRKVGGINELFINRAQSGPQPNFVRLTNTEKAARDLEYGAGEFTISFYESPNKRVILFNVIEGYGGDFGLPNSTYVINRDGSYQQLIDRIGYFNPREQVWYFCWTADDALVYRIEDPDNDPDAYENLNYILMLRTPDGTITTLKKLSGSGRLNYRPRS